MKISDFARSFSWQSTSLPGRVEISSAFLRPTFSRASCAAFRAAAASTLLAIPAAVLLGVPTYLNGYAAVPLVQGLINLGMSPAVGLAFVTAGAATSIPAALAVWALVRPPVFLGYLGFATVGSLAVGYAYAAFLGWG